MTIGKLYSASFGLLADLYELTMAYGYWKSGLDKYEAVFHLNFRHRPFNGGFAISAGLEMVIAFLNSFHFSKDDTAYLSHLVGDDNEPLFHPDFLKYLEALTFSCDMYAVPEGTAVFPYEPLLRIQGPLLQCQLLESALLNMINFQTLIATKAARICIAARDDPVIEFGIRRAQGIDGAISASRAAYIGGCQATSNVLAGKLFNIPVKGTQAHSWIMAFDNEFESFKVYADAMPNNCVFLVDTYNTIEGVKNAIAAGKILREQGKNFAGIRLDSGDLAYLSIESRKLLDEAGFKDTHILASNELDEIIISDLLRQGAKISVWGVGTNLVTAKDQPALDGVYKLSALRRPGGEWRYKVKLSEQMIKVTNPGILQVRRYIENNEYIADAICDINTPSKPGCCVIIDPLDITKQKYLSDKYPYKELLEPIFKEGKQVYELPTLQDIQQRAKNELNHFHQGIKRFIHPHQYPVGLEKNLYNLKITLIREIRRRGQRDYESVDSGGFTK